MTGSRSNDTRRPMLGDDLAFLPCVFSVSFDVGCHSKYQGTAVFHRCLCFFVFKAG